MKEYIYYLLDPRDGIVRYVGKSKDPNKRYRQHIKKLDKRNTPKKLWLLKLFSLDMKPTLEIKEIVEGARAREREQYHVDKNRATTLNIHNPAKGAKARKRDENGKFEN